MIYMAPLQGYTDFILRREFRKHFSGVDAYFIPYISLKNGEPEKRQVKEINPENNIGLPVVPQILFSDRNEVEKLLKILRDLGYNQANLNLGCPYPMVTRRGRGAGLLPFPGKIEEALAETAGFPEIGISAKLRLGLEDPDEIFAVAEVLNRFPLKEIICHPRVASQLYKGKTDGQTFARFLEISKNPVAYNGDIFSLEDFKDRQQKFPEVKNWMLGRGLLMNPFLAEEISEKPIPRHKRIQRLRAFHTSLYESYSKQLSGPGHVLTKMGQFWEYFSFSFPNPHKTFKSIKKARNTGAYERAVNLIFSNPENLS